MDSKAPRTWSLVLVPAVVSLIVTILRLVGELQGWNDQFFSNVAPGGEHKPGFVGISWLIPIFGFWFGFKLRRSTGQPPHAGKSALRFLIGAAIVIGGFFGLAAAGLIVVPNADAPGEPKGLEYALGLLVLAAIVMITAWPRLACVLVLYALLARIPVVAVTYFALQKGWDSHYTKLPVGTTLPLGVDRFTFLAMPQMTVWIVATVMLGGLFGCLGAVLAGRGPK
ncbi:MAG: hypothetical protein ABIP94_22710 [Planctomycetota bacterium]